MSKMMSHPPVADGSKLFLRKSYSAERPTTSPADIFFAPMPSPESGIPLKKRFTLPVLLLF